MENMETKKCYKCKEEKPTFEFYKNKSTKDGLSYTCKLCSFKKNQQYRENNKELIRERDRQYRENNKELIRQRSKQYRENNKERIREQKRQYRENNKERIREINKKYYENNSEKVYELKKKWVKNNPETNRLIKNKHGRKSRKMLSDLYIKHLILRGNNNLESKDIPQSLVQAYREKIRVLRLIKKMSN